MERCGSGCAVGLACALLGGGWFPCLPGTLLTLLVPGFLPTNPLLLALPYPVANEAWAAVAASDFAVAVGSIAIAAM